MRTGLMTYRPVPQRVADRRSVGRGWTGRSAGDGSDPAFRRPSCGVGPCVFSHATVPARSLPSIDPCGKAGGPIRIGTLVFLGTALGAAFGNAIVAPLPFPSSNPALDLVGYYDSPWRSSPARPGSIQRATTATRRLQRWPTLRGRALTRPTIWGTSCTTARSPMPEGSVHNESPAHTSAGKPAWPPHVWRRSPRATRFPPCRSCSPSST